MTARLSERLKRARRSLFVGRNAERQLFDAALQNRAVPRDETVSDAPDKLLVAANLDEAKREISPNSGASTIFESETILNEKVDFSASAHSSWSVLHVFGPGGIGKSALLHEFAEICETRGAHAIFLDAREIEPQPAAFERALSMALQTDEKPLDFLAKQTQCHVLFFDTYERLTPLDSWLRETFFPQLPDAHRAVLAGRNAPREGWKLDSGWQNLLRALPLKNLDRADSHAFLNQRHLPTKQHNRVLDFTHGHPLALSLVADAFDQRHSENSDENANFSPHDAPEIVRILVAHLVEEVPNSRQRAAIEACALVRWTTESLLSHLLRENSSLSSGNSNSSNANSVESAPSDSEIAALFDWLRGLSFIEAGAQGLCPHDMAREALVANLRWRNPQAYADFHQRARDFYATQLQQTSTAAQQRVLADYIFLHHDNAVIRPFLEWQEGSELTISPPREAEIPLLLEMVRRHRGENEAQIAAFWFALQPDSLFVVRNARGEIEGFWCQLALHRTDVAERENDAAAEKAWQLLQESAPLRSQESATLFRFWMARDTNQQVGAVQSLIFVNIVRHYLTTPKLAFSLLLCDDTEFWAPIFRYAGANFTAFESESAESSTRNAGIYSHDWRIVPPLSWLDQMAQQETDASALDASANSNRIASKNASIISPEITEEEFALAVREALKFLHRPAALEGNLLLRSQLFSEEKTLSSAQKVVHLQNLVRQSCEMLRDSGKTDKWYQALRWRYLEPLKTQEAAAERMDVPFSTFRRYVKSGVERVVETLWQQYISQK